MDLRLRGKTALVTGASAGIGRAIAKALAAEGVELCVAARRGELLEQLSSEIVSAGGIKPHIVIADILREETPPRLAEQAIGALGHVDILVNSAGGTTRVHLDTPAARWMEVMNMNYIRVHQLIMALVPHMIHNKWGRIINVSGKSEPEHLSAVTGPKAALHGFSKALSRELGQHGITVNSLAPGRIMSEQIRKKYTPEFRAEQSKRDIPMGRYGEPEELADLATFLASPRAGYITGVVIAVDGGLRRYAF